MLEEIRHDAVHARLDELAMSLVLQLQVHGAAQSPGRFIAKGHGSDRIGCAGQQQRRDIAFQRRWKSASMGPRGQSAQSARSASSCVTPRNVAPAAASGFRLP